MDLIIKQMKNFLQIACLALTLIFLASCTDTKPIKRKVQYMGDTDMYTSVPYDTYSDNPEFKNGISAQKPVEGTIARGEELYEVPNNEVGYQFAKDSIHSPLKVNEENLKNGEKMYKLYCAVCHGDTGDGQGVLVKNEKFLGVPNYKDREITEGSIHHVIMYGRNMMGSHASQLTDKERWQVVQYVEKLRTDLLQ